MYCCLKPQGLGRLLRYFPLVFVVVDGLRLQKSSENASYSAKRVSPINTKLPKNTKAGH